MQLPQGGVGVFESLGAVSAVIMCGFLQFDSGFFQSANCGVHARMPWLSNRERDGYHYGHPGQETF
jgi:hypothetical protein